VNQEVIEMFRWNVVPMVNSRPSNGKNRSRRHLSFLLSGTVFCSLRKKPNRCAHEIPRWQPYSSNTKKWLKYIPTKKYRSKEIQPAQPTHSYWAQILRGILRNYLWSIEKPSESNIETKTDKDQLSSQKATVTSLPENSWERSLRRLSRLKGCVTCLLLNLLSSIPTLELHMVLPSQCRKRERFRCLLQHPVSVSESVRPLSHICPCPIVACWLKCVWLSSTCVFPILGEVLGVGLYPLVVAEVCLLEFE
jgi:hypothetical protein